MKHFSFISVIALLLFFTSCESAQDKFNRLKEMADQSFAMYEEMSTEDAATKDLNKWVERWTEQSDRMQVLVDEIAEDEEFPDEEIDRVIEGYKLAVGMGYVSKFGATMKHLDDNFQNYSASDWEENANKMEEIATEAKEDRDNDLIRDEEWVMIQSLLTQYQQKMNMAVTLGLGETGQLN